MNELDEDDLKILRLLQEDGRTPYSEISRILNIPQSTVRFKVNKLVEGGFVKKFVAVLDPVKMGYPIVLIMLLRIHPKKLDEIFNYISKIPEVHHMFQITGKYDLVAIFHARDMNDVGKVNNMIRSLEGVLDADTLLATGRLLVKSTLPI